MKIRHSRCVQKSSHLLVHWSNRHDSYFLCNEGHLQLNNRKAASGMRTWKTARSLIHARCVFDLAGSHYVKMKSGLPLEMSIHCSISRKMQHMLKTDNIQLKSLWKDKDINKLRLTDRLIDWLIDTNKERSYAIDRFPAN